MEKRIDDADACLAVANHLGVSASARRRGRAVIADALSSEPIEPKLLWVPMGRDLRLAWRFELTTPDGRHVYDVTVDAEPGADPPRRRARPDALRPRLPGALSSLRPSDGEPEPRRGASSRRRKRRRLESRAPDRVTARLARRRHDRVPDPAREQRARLRRPRRQQSPRPRRSRTAGPGSSAPSTSTSTWTRARTPRRRSPISSTGRTSCTTSSISMASTKRRGTSR